MLFVCMLLSCGAMLTSEEGISVAGCDEELVDSLVTFGHSVVLACEEAVARFTITVAEGRNRLTGKIWQLNVETMDCDCPKDDKCVHHIVLYKGDMFSPEVFNRICGRLRDRNFQLQGDHCFCISNRTICRTCSRTSCVCTKRVVARFRWARHLQKSRVHWKDLRSYLLFGHMKVVDL